MCDKSTVFVALSSNEVLFYDVSGNDFELVCSKTFDYSVKEIDCFGVENEYIFFVLLENGNLYSFGKNYHNIISDECSDDVNFSKPQLISSDVKMMTFQFYVKNDNSIVIFVTSKEFVISIGDVDNVFTMWGIGYLIINDSLYSLSGDNSKIVFVKSLRDFHYEFDYCSSLYVDNSNKIYFTGLCYGDHSIKDVSDYYVEYIPANYNYLPIYRAIVCYDEHTILCYAVVED